MFFTIAYTIIMMLYIGIMIYRIIKKTFSNFLREEIGFVICFIILSIPIEVSGVLKEIYIPIVLLVFLIGYIRK